MVFIKLVQCFGLHRMMALPPSLSTAALCTCALSTPPLFSSPFIRGWDSTVDSSRLFAIPDFHPSTFDITSGFQFLNFLSYLGGVWSSSMIRDAVATVVSYWFQFCLLTSCTRGALCTTMWSPPTCFSWQGIILRLILMGQVPFWNFAKFSSILIFYTVFFSKYR
jgi:hypothetical protein